jgi:hypothetical protein
VPEPGELLDGGGVREDGEPAAGMEDEEQSRRWQGRTVRSASYRARRHSPSSFSSVCAQCRGRC